jgi:hypothetical protein
MKELNDIMGAMWNFSSPKAYLDFRTFIMGT